jgi:SAM-dependent methyltransferase
MSNPEARFVGTVPANYDRYLGPFLFERYADDLAARLPVREGARVLEVACGTGILSERLRQRLPESATLVATDLNEPMIDVARAKLGDAAIEWRTADAAALPFSDASFDAVAFQFGLMFVPDKAAAFGEARRVLADGGTLLASVWYSREENPHTLAIQEALVELFPADPPGFLETPHGFHDSAVIERLAREAGFSEVTLERVAMTGTADSAESVATGFARGSPLYSEVMERGADMDVVVATLTAALERLGGARPFSAPLAALVLTAR